MELDVPECGAWCVLGLAQEPWPFQHSTIPTGIVLCDTYRLIESRYLQVHGAMLTFTNSLYPCLHMSAYYKVKME